MTPDTEQQITRLREAYPEYVDVDGPYDDALVARVEAALGVRLPPSYRAFLLRYGTLELSPNEVYGVTRVDRDRGVGESVVPGTVRFTLDRRERLGLPATFVVVMDHDGVEYDCLDTGAPDPEGECPVVRWNVPTRGGVSVRVAPSFDAFLAMMLEEFEASVAEA